MAKASRGPAKKRWRRIYLREWRVSLHLTVEQLADRAGVSPGLISQIENGVSGGSGESLGKIAAALGIEVGMLFDVKPTDGGGLISIWVHNDDRPVIEELAKVLAARH